MVDDAWAKLSKRARDRFMSEDADVDAKADAEERSAKAEAQMEDLRDEVKRAKIEALTTCLEIAHECEGPSSSVYGRIKDMLEDEKNESPFPKDDLVPEVVALEERFAENPDNEALCRQLHIARVRTGWSEFRVDTASGADPRSTIPWVATREVTWSEEWTGNGAPSSEWLKPAGEILDRGRVKKIGNHRLCDDKKWRRDVTQELDVVAVENLAHLRSIVTRMEDVVIYKPDATGLCLLTIFDQGAS